jgi:CRISPR-associated protein Cmr3
MSTSVFIEPLDVLLLRGNKLFGDPGSHGEALIPPWPSVAAGALRSRMLADDGVDLAAFGAIGRETHPLPGHACSAGRRSPSPAFIWRAATPTGARNCCMAPPADLVVFEERAPRSVQRMAPTAPAAGLASSAELPLLPVLAAGGAAQAGRRLLADRGGLGRTIWPVAYPRPKPIGSGPARCGSSTTASASGLDAERRRAKDGQLFSMQAIAFAKREHGGETDVGFLATVSGAEPPTSGLVRLGGDGRAAALHPVNDYRPPAPDYEAIVAARCCRLLLTSPGLFAGGWLPSGANAATRRADGAIRFELHGAAGLSAPPCRAPRSSGLGPGPAAPKPACAPRPPAASTGSTTWRPRPRRSQACRAGPVARRPAHDAQRRAEGFNRYTFAAS